MTSATSDYLLVTDYLDAPLIGPVGHCPARRSDPAARRALRPGGGPATCARSGHDSGRLGGLRQRPPRVFNALYQELSALDAEPGVTVQLHPVSSLGLIAWQLSASKERRMANHRRNNVVRNYT